MSRGEECSNRWKGYLHVYFQRRGYFFVDAHYGRQFDGYMGVGIAFPFRRFEAMAISIQRVADTKKWWPERSSTSSKNPGDKVDELIDLAGYFASPYFFDAVDGIEEVDEEQDEDERRLNINPWDYSRARQNMMVCVKLKPRGGIGDGSSFVVATYHMPCAYWAPKVMVIHTALATQCAQRFADAAPLILAGDWNFKPGAAPYQLLTTGRLAEDHPAHPGSLEGDSWRPEEGLKAMRSAYADKNPGGEPEFTNYAWVRNDEDPFIGTLDYIFVSQQCTVTGVSKLPNIRSCPSPLPTASEPSDHLMLSARLLPHGRRTAPKKQEKERKLSRPPSVPRPARPSGKDSGSGRTRGEPAGFGAGRGDRKFGGNRPTILLKATAMPLEREARPEPSGARLAGFSRAVPALNGRSCSDSRSRHLRGCLAATGEGYAPDPVEHAQGESGAA
jgi:endonuclease/exonuclease/phosphatase family metal-dependent hydrolase